MPPLDWFRIRDERSFELLPKWIKKQPVNTYSFPRQDRNGDWIILLGWDDRPDSDWGRFKGNRAAIWAGSDKAFALRVEVVVRDALNFAVPTKAPWL
jgi:hypothetical protein